MSTKALALRIFTITALSVAAAAAGPDSGRSGATAISSSVPTSHRSLERPLPTQTPTVGERSTIGQDESSSIAVTEPPFGYSAARRSEQAQRQDLRRRLDWRNLDPALQTVLAPYAVGPDQLDAMGRANVSFAWSVTPQLVANSDRQIRDAFLNVVGDLIVTGSRTTPTDRIYTAEISGAASGSEVQQNWVREFGLAGTNTATLNATTADLYGNTYVAGAHSNGSYILWEFSGADGSNIGSLTNFAAGGSASASGVAIDPIEGFIYVAGRGSGIYSSGFLARHRPDSSHARDWIVPMPWGGGGNPTLTDPIRINRRGEIFVVGFNSSHMAISKFNPIDGSADWTWVDANASYGQAIDIDFDGNPIITGIPGNAVGWITKKFDRLTGAVVWTATESTGVAQDIAVDMDGNSYVCGTPGSGGNTFALRKYNTSGVVQWSRQWGTTQSGGPRLVTLDRLGNPYVTGSYSVGVDTHKFDPATGADAWTVSDNPTYDGTETNSNISTTGINVDANGSVYVAGYRTASKSGLSSCQEYFTIKYTQPYLYIPLLTKSHPDIRMEKRSLWSPTIQDDLNNTVPNLFNPSFNLFSFPLKPVTDLINQVTYGRASYGLQGNGLAEGGLTFGFTNADAASVGVRFDASVTGGTFDATVKGELTIATPPDGGAGGLSVGQQVPFTIEFTPDPKSLELIANNAPVITAALSTDVTGDMTIDAYAHDTTAGTILDHTSLLPSKNLTYLDNIKLISFDSTQFTIPLNEWYDIRKSSYPQSEFANAQVRLPTLRAQSSYDATAALLTSSISEKFAKGQVNVTNIASYYATEGFVPSFTYNESHTLWGIDAYLGFVQAYFRGDISVTQDLTLELRPYVKLAFDNGKPTQTVTLAKTASPSGGYTYQGSYTTNWGLPSDGNVQVTPTFGMKAVLTNRTGLLFGLYAGFNPVDVDISASVVGYDVLGIDRCIACLEQDLIALVPGNSRVGSFLNGGRTDLFNKTFPEFTFPLEVTQSPFLVVGDINNQPELAGSSREFAPMTIYNQRTPPTQTQFNALVNTSQPMVLYGNKFFSTTPNLAVKMELYGRTESLPFTRLNDQALLVQVPGRMFLLPGTSHIWVQNNNGRSKTIEFPIEYPTPNFTGLSDTIWAGDPRWAGDGTAPGQGLIALDGGTPGGNDTFIARRDYYTYLRNNLWNSGFLPSGNTSTAAQYFPGFNGWETGSTKYPPGFPTLVALNGTGSNDDVALSRFRQAPPLSEYVNDGYFRSNLQEGLHDAPKFLDFVLVNPGPGGGESRVQTVEIPAPRPVLSELVPNTVTPGSVATGQFLRIDVRGPESVPFFAGFEVEKYGNFTTGSVVRIDGAAVSTEYVNPGLLVASIPASYLSSFGSHIITVRTPSGGTSFHEHQLTGSGTVAFDGDVTSGGISDPLVLEVVWAQPVIVSVGQSTLNVNEPPKVPTAVNGVPVNDTRNFSITGRNFAPNCTVLWDGAALPFTRDSDGELRATLSATNVSVIGRHRVEVANPAPNARTSNAFAVTVVQPPPLTRRLSPQLSDR